MGRSKTTRKTRTAHQRSRVPWILGALALSALVILATVVYAKEYRFRSGHAPVVEPTGRSDASGVLDPTRFRERRQQEAYAVAQQIPAVLNQLYCWCGCKEHSGHRALLECFESEHAAQCVVCMGEAMLARTMVRQGVTDIRAIQDAIDQSWTPGRGTS